MTTTKAIKSIKTNASAWSMTEKKLLSTTFSNGDWQFVRISIKVGGGYVLRNDKENVLMKWKEGDAIGSQLWQYLFISYFTPSK